MHERPQARDPTLPQPGMKPRVQRRGRYVTGRHDQEDGANLYVGEAVVGRQRRYGDARQGGEEAKDDEGEHDGHDLEGLGLGILGVDGVVVE